MKKIIALVLVMLLTTVGAFADGGVPEFLAQSYNNFTADYTVSMSFDNPGKVAELLGELQMPEQIGYFIDMESFLKSLFSYEGSVKVQADVSNDYRKIKLSMVSDSSQYVEFNRNLNMDINSKLGLWMNMDLTDRDNIMFDIIYDTPFMNKYLCISDEDVINESGSEEMYDFFASVFDKEFIESLNQKIMDSYSKYADIQGGGSKYTISLDNEALISYMDEIIPVINEEITKLAGQDAELMPPEFPSLKGLKLLGKEGIRCDFALKGGKIYTESITADICIDIPSIYTAVTGEEWPYVSDGIIDFTLEMSADISKHGTTKVDYPVITEDNSFTISDLEPEYEYAEDYEYQSEYPMWYAGEYCGELPVINDDIYVPLRLTLESAYADSVNIEYADGVITAQSEYFDGFDSIIVDTGKDTVIAGEAVYRAGVPVVIDGVTYVSSMLFTDVFGWEFSEATYDIMTGEYYYSFFTNAW